MTGRTGRAPTLDEVAERAGVSRSAASRVINNANHVSPATRRAVERAVRDHGHPLVDELVVVDSDSRDGTAEIVLDTISGDLSLMTF